MHAPRRFLRHVEVGYLDNPYHNRVHAADVVRCTHVMLLHGGLMPGYCGDGITLLATYLAAVSDPRPAGHDQWHPQGPLACLHASIQTVPAALDICHLHQASLRVPTRTPD